MPEFKSVDEGQWFYFDSKNETLGGVCLRELSSDEYERIEKLTVKKSKKFKRGIPYDDIKTDEKLASKLRWDFCIVNWTQISLDDQMVDCTAENKVKLMKVLDFVKFVADKLSDLTDANRSLDEARLKNSGSSSSDSPENQTAIPA